MNLPVNGNLMNPPVNGNGNLMNPQVNGNGIVKVNILKKEKLLLVKKKEKEL